jgi:hypothetical protein
LDVIDLLLVHVWVETATWMSGSFVSSVKPEERDVRYSFVVLFGVLGK